MNDAAYGQLGAWIDAHLDEQVAFLRELVRVPTDTPPGDNAPHARRTAELLRAMGHAVEEHAVPETEVRAAGLGSIVNLVVRERFGAPSGAAGGASGGSTPAAGPTIALNAHGDVVPPGNGWTHPPYAGEIEGGRMFGRGVAVSKSDFATYTFALRALQALAAAGGARLRGAIELHFTYDEEFGGELGPGWLLARGITRPDLALGAGFSYAIVTAHNGCLQLEVTVHGVAAHAAMPETGADALAAAIAAMNAVYALRARWTATRSAVEGIGSPTVNIGRIEGGINTNVVPDRVSFRLDRRMIPEEDPAAVEAELRGAIEAALAGRPGIRVEIRRLLLARALRPLPGHEALVETLRVHAAREFGAAVEPTGTPLYTDARLYGEAGVPIVLYGAGPRTILEANAKRADENLVLEDLRRATRVVACALLDLLAEER